MTDPRPWTTARALVAIRHAISGAPAGPDRAAGERALDWLTLRIEELERRGREDDVTREIPTP